MSARTTATDPTMDLMRDLRNPAKFVRVQNVPIFKPHERTKVLANGQRQVIKVTKDDLATIARNSTAVMRFGPGHIIGDPMVPECDQPETVAYFLEPRAGTFGPDNEPAILATAYIPRDRYREFKGYPYRSAEYFAHLKQIKGVALLRRYPELDMGMIDFADHIDRHGLTHYAASEQPTLYLMGNDMEPNDSMSANGLTPEDESWERGHSNYMQRCAPYGAWHKGMMTSYDAGMPSATNDLPGAGGPPPMPGPPMPGLPGGASAPPPTPPPTTPPSDPAMYAADMNTLRGVVAAQGQKLDALVAENARLKAEAETAAVERLVDDEMAAYEIDRPDYVERLVALPADQRKAKLDRLKQTAKPKPAGRKGEIPFLDTTSAHASYAATATAPLPPAADASAAELAEADASWTNDDNKAWFAYQAEAGDKVPLNVSRTEILRRIVARNRAAAKAPPTRR